MKSEDYVVVTTISSHQVRYVMHRTDLWELYLKKAPQKIARATSGGTLDGYREMGQKIAGLEAERDYLSKQLLTIRAHAGDATEYVLAQINKELVEERDHLQTEFDSLAKSFLKSGIEMYISMGYSIEEATEIAEQVFEEVGE